MAHLKCLQIGGQVLAAVVSLRASTRPVQGFRLTRARSTLPGRAGKMNGLDGAIQPVGPAVPAWD